MKFLPVTEHTLVLRTDFSNDKAWESLCNDIVTPDKELGFIPYVEFVSDKEFENLSQENLKERIPPDYPNTFFFIVDNITFQSPEHPILCIDIYEEPIQALRALPRAMWGIENNLFTGNMDFNEFVLGADSDGIFRVFK